MATQGRARRAIRLAHQSTGLFARTTDIFQLARNLDLSREIIRTRNAVEQLSEN
jgi:hypothetical protein